MFQDVFGLPAGSQADVQTFRGGGGWRTWNRPRGKTMAYMFCSGSGGGGGGGWTAATGVDRPGGGGGGGGAVARLVIPILFLPDILYVQAGARGTGGAAGVNGVAGNRSYICTSPVQGNAALTFLQSGATAAGLGQTSSVAPASSGFGEVVSTVALCALGAAAGITQFIVGQNGGPGGNTTGANGGAGTAVTYSATTPFSGGPGGGTSGSNDAEFAGGALTGAGLIPTVTGGVAGGNPGNGQGAGILWRPLIQPAGSGGGTGGAAGTVGGRGADAQIGSGGAGGGGGVTGGRGGNGGDGLVLIISW